MTTNANDHSVVDMKRTTQLQRKAFARPSAVDPKTGKKRYSTFAAPTKALARTRLRRTRMKQKPPTLRPADQGGDGTYLDFVRGLPCCVYGTAAPSHAHHETGNGRGKGQKAPDNRTMPMSFRAHREFHDGKGHFEFWTADARRIWQEVEIQRVQDLFAAYQAGTRFTEVA